MTAVDPVNDAVAVRTPTPGSVHANSSWSPWRTMRGTPLARAALTVATDTANDAMPLAATRRTRSEALSDDCRSIQSTTGCASSSSTTLTRPIGSPSSTRTGGPKLAPPSTLTATRTRAVSCAPVNHATATVSPSAATDGPFTGQPSKRHSSAWTRCGALHAPSCQRTIAMSRISSGERSRYTMTRPVRVAALAVWQQSHARASSSCSTATVSSRPRVVVRTVISRALSGMAVLRPSSQTAPTRSPPAGQSVTKPCSAARPSPCGVTGGSHVAPPSRDRTSRMP